MCSVAELLSECIRHFAHGSNVQLLKFYYKKTVKLQQQWYTYKGWHLCLYIYSNVPAACYPAREQSWRMVQALRLRSHGILLSSSDETSPYTPCTRTRTSSVTDRRLITDLSTATTRKICLPSNVHRRGVVDNNTHTHTQLYSPFEKAAQ